MSNINKTNFLPVEKNLVRSNPNLKNKNNKPEFKTEKWAILLNGSSGTITHETETHYSIEIEDRQNQKISIFVPKGYVESTNIKSSTDRRKTKFHS